MARWLWMIYIGLTGLEIILLLFGGMSLFDAVCHSFSTTATGGFSTKQAKCCLLEFSLYRIRHISVYDFVGSKLFALLFIGCASQLYASS